MKIVPRTVKASFTLESINGFLTKCPRGLLQPKEYFARQVNYFIKEWCILTQSSKSGWECISESSKLRFSNNPLMSKLCPGANKLKITALTEDLRRIELVREPCWETPPKGFYFCKKHFNTYYGQYIRYVFGTAKPNKNNPFFRVPALLYTIFYGGDTLKVGTTVIVKGFRRFMEQPYLLTSVLYIGNNIEIVRKLEVGLSKNTPLSQAPKTRRRIRELKEALSKGIDCVRNKFICKVMNYLEIVKSNPELPEVKEIIAGIIAEGFHINNIKTYGDDLLINSVIPQTLYDANKLLKNAECVIKSLSRGFLVMDCGRKVISIPYELLRDRLITLEYLR